MRTLSNLLDYPEIFQLVLHQADDASLATLLRTSKRVFISASAILYETLYLDNHHFSKVFEGAFLQVKPFNPDCKAEREERVIWETARTRWGWTTEKRFLPITNYKRYQLGQVKILVIGDHESHECLKMSSMVPEPQVVENYFANLKAIRIVCTQMSCRGGRVIDPCSQHPYSCDLLAELQAPRFVIRGHSSGDTTRYPGRPWDGFNIHHSPRVDELCLQPGTGYEFAGPDEWIKNNIVARDYPQAKRVRVVLGNVSKHPLHSWTPEPQIDCMKANTSDPKDLISYFRKVCHTKTGLIWEIYGLEQLPFQKKQTGKYSPREIPVLPQTAEHDSILQSIYYGITQVTSTTSDGGTVTTRRSDMVFGTLGQYYASDTFGELSEWEKYEYKQRKDEEETCKRESTE